MAITDKPVLVTGVTGYIGAEVARQLLAAGYRVRGTTRDIARAREAAHVTALPGGADRLELVEADLLDPDTIGGAIVGCEYVIHVASPYVLDVEEPQRDLVEPAVEGTLTVLRSATVAETVKRIVLTSSVAAVSGAPRERPFNEDDWNRESRLDNAPYSFSKTLAERAAWDYVESVRPSFDLVSINPSGVIGPSIVPRLNQSGLMFSNLTNGELPGIISLYFAYVDIRDVGRSHLAAMETATASGRYICSAQTVSVRHIVDVMRRMGIDDRYKLPSLPLDNGLGNVVVRLAANMQPKATKAFLKAYVGRTSGFDTSRIRDGLGIKFRDIDDTLVAAIEDAERWGHLGKKTPVGSENFV